MSAFLPFVPDKSKVEREFNDWIESEDGKKVEREALSRMRRLSQFGHLHFGVSAIFEAIRYDWSIGLLGDGDYRLNNNHRSFLARRLREKNPEFTGFFEVRELRGRR